MLYTEDEAHRLYETMLSVIPGARQREHLLEAYKLWKDDMRTAKAKGYCFEAIEYPRVEKPELRIICTNPATNPERFEHA